MCPMVVWDSPSCSLFVVSSLALLHLRLDPIIVALAAPLVFFLLGDFLSGMVDFVRGMGFLLEPSATAARQEATAVREREMASQVCATNA